jgi:hypothetical protein
MSIDHYYTLVEGKIVRVGFEEVESVCGDSDFWVDICHGGGSFVDERYYFPDLESALLFYLEGWKDRQFEDDAGNPLGLDHSGLYSQRRLIHGLSILGTAPGYKAKNTRQIFETVDDEDIDEEEAVDDEDIFGEEKADDEI